MPLARTLAFGLLAPLLLAACAEETPPAAGAPTCDALKAQTFTLAYPGDFVALWDTTMGCFALELYLEKAPITAGNFQNLTKEGFYDGTRFHRVIAGFMIQDGDPNSKDTAKKSSWGTGGPGYTIKDEFPCKEGATVVGSPGSGCATRGGLLFRHEAKGVLSMANSGANTGGSQYFITLAPTTHLDGKHAIFGKVLAGMDVVEAIGVTPTASGDRPVTDVVITRLFIQGS